MSISAENVLYIGHNIKLVEAMLNSFNTAANHCCYNTRRLNHCNELQAALAEKQYSHLICEVPVNKILSDKIQEDFPYLNCIYLADNDVNETPASSATESELLTDEVKAALECISIPVYYKNRQGEFLACNTYFAQALGMTTALIIGKTAAEILPAHLLPGLEQVDQKVFADNQVHLYECEYTDAAGIHREVVFRKEAMGCGEIQMGTMLDMSEINQTKRLLEKERIMLRTTADLSPDLIFFKDLQSRFLGCNKEFEKFVGCSEGDILGKKDDQLFELDQALMCQAQDQDVMTTKQIYSGKEYLTYKDGVRHFIEMKKVPLLDKGGKVQGLVGIGRNITADHLMQKRLKIADTVFENSKEGVLVTDGRDKIISANIACRHISGFSEAELLQLNIRTFLLQHYDESFYKNIESLLKKNKCWQGEITYSDKNGEIHFCWLEIHTVEHAGEGITNNIYSFTDLSQSRSAEEKIQFLSKHDPLTGLFNRIALFTRLEDAIARAHHKEAAMAVLLVDVSGFKKINDQYGHHAGDKALKEAARRLKQCVFAKETVARFGDNEFVIIIDELANEQVAALVAQKIALQFNEKMIIDNIEAQLSVTIGISLSPDDGIDVDTLLKNAEQAMLRGKKDKSAQYHFYTPELTRYSSQQLQLELELKNALEVDQFELYYQPQYDLNKRQISAVGAQLRWNHPQQGLLFPEQFLILAQESGLLIPLDLKMLRKAAEQAVVWQKSAVNFGRIAVNISKAQLSQNCFIADLHSILKETNCSGRWLEFEVDKSILRHSSVEIQSNLLNLGKMGIALTITNFGIASTVLDLINLLGVEKLKVSKHYVSNSSGALVNEALSNSVNVFARTLGISVVGDTVENAPQEVFSASQHSASAQVNAQVKAMKSTEMTFYLRCNKRK
ncbi:sensor domain-containing protein [Psychromonas ossibalaenae]|uniref:sensor domain-containing protein n=1 Tax=Psychromonas ossibalaenae TaxID=444922 RepID=UPI00037C855E|nr:diguanylate cyclase [Psychromonas ossibalaenae]